MKSKKEIQKTLLRCNCQGLVTLDQEAANKGGGEAKVLRGFELEYLRECYVHS